MSKHPIVRLRREPVLGTRAPGNQPRFARAVSFDRQTARLGSKFAAIAADLDSLTSDVRVRTNPDAIIPGRALVFEVIGPVADFAKALTTAGFDWLAEAEAGQDLDDDDEEDSVDSNAGELASLLKQPVLTDNPPERLYLTMSNETALRQMLELWNAYKTGRRHNSRIEKPWWTLFGYLSDVRIWSAKDRIEAAVAAHLRQMAAGQVGGLIRFELDLWFRGSDDARTAAVAQVAEIVATVQGNVLDTVEIEPVRYLAMLVDLPVEEAIRLADLGGPLATAAAVMSVRPQSTYRAPVQDDDEEFIGPKGAGPAIEDRRLPIVALLDGYPISDHSLLANRIDVSEIDVLGRLVPVNRRYHGTAMASLILHGDLAAGEAALTRTLKVVPILGAGQGTAVESTPSDRLGAVATCVEIG